MPNYLELIQNIVKAAQKTIKATKLSTEMDKAMKAGEVDKTALTAASKVSAPSSIQYTPEISSELNNSYLGFLQQPPKRISLAEHAGIPKGERSTQKSVELENGFFRKDDRTTFQNASPQIVEDTRPLIDLSQYKIQEELDNATRILEHQLRDWNKVPISFNTGDPNILKQYAGSLSEVDPRFLRSDGNQSFYIQQFRQYLADTYGPTKSLTDEELAKILTAEYKRLSEQQTGLAKGKILFHGSQSYPERFDWRMTGTSTGNMGYVGPANYFRNYPSYYGFQKSRFGGTDSNRFQPFLIDNVTSIPLASNLVEKGILPHYISPGSYGKEDYISKVLNPAIEHAKESNILIVDDISMYPQNFESLPISREFPLLEFGITRNSGIKSLFPHPSTIVRNADGTFTVNRNWNDLRVNHKNGGKFQQYIDMLKVGESPKQRIHIKKKKQREIY